MPSRGGKNSSILVASTSSVSCHVRCPSISIYSCLTLTTDRDGPGSPYRTGSRSSPTLISCARLASSSAASGGGIIEWPGEEMYCRALRALRFVNASAKLPADMGRGAATALQHIAFRRFLADGAALARFEIGFAYRTAQQKVVRLNKKDFIALVRFVRSQEVVVPHDSSRRSCTLAEASQFLAKHYLRASQSLKAAPPESWWVSPG